MQTLTRSALARLPRLGFPRVAACVVGLLGLLAIGASSFLPWFTIPHAGVTAGDDLRVVWMYRCLSPLVLAIAGFNRVLVEDWRRRCETLFVGFLVALLFFPYCVSVWCPTVAGEASWLQAQHESLTATSGDIYASQETKDDFWRHHVYIVSRPIQSEVARLPDGGLRRLTWGRFIEVSNWFGLSAWWSAFLRKGWAIAIGGAVAVLFALCRESLDGPLPAAGRVLRRGAVTISSALILTMMPILASCALLEHAKEQTQLGNYRDALHTLRFARCVMPAVGEDGEFIAQLGLLENATGEDTAEACFYRATLLENQGFGYQAENIYLGLISETERSTALRREAAEALLRRSASHLDGGELDQAINLLDTIVRADPCNLKALYALQLAYLRRGDVNALTQLQRRLEETYREFNSPIKETVIADSNEILALGHYRQDNLAAAMKAWRSARR